MQRKRKTEIVKRKNITSIHFHHSKLSMSDAWNLIRYERTGFNRK